jgi:hypothetical protein
MLLENIGNSGIFADGAVRLLGGVSAFAMQMMDQLGGVRGVESLFVIGFIIGLLACFYEIKKING